MKKDDSIFLKHMLDAINLIEEYLRDKDYDEFKNNRMLQDAVIREIEIIGETTKNLSMEFRNKHPNIPWRFRGGYRRCMGVMRDIPSLKEKLQKIIKEGKK